MVDGFITDKNKMEFREIILQQLKRILELCSNEFRGGYWTQKQEGYQVVRQYIPDSRKCYIQSVENFSIILFPHFDKTMVEAYKKYNESIEKDKKELKKKYTEKDELKFNLVENKLVLAHTLFKDLNSLLHRKKYLKSAVYGEGYLEEE